MIEKAFEKSYPITVTKQTLARLANRFIDDYKKAIGTTSDEYLPDDIKSAAAKIKNCNEVELTDYEHTSTSSGSCCDFRIYDTEKWQIEYHFWACYDRDEYGDDTYCVTWYFFSNSRYKKTIGDKKIEDNSMEKLARKVYAALGEYRYFCTHRPPACGCIPDGFVHYETYCNGSRYIGEVTYNTKPSNEELYNLGLVLDKDFARERAAYLEVQDGTN